MTRRLDLDRTLEDWLNQGPSQLPDRAIDGIVRQLDEAKQRRRLWPPRRDFMNRMFLSLGGVGAAVFAAAIAFAFLFGSPTPPPAESPASPAGTPAPPASVSPGSSSPTASPEPAAWIVGSGGAEGDRWVATAERRPDELCIAVEFNDRSEEGVCMTMDEVEHQIGGLGGLNEPRGSVRVITCVVPEVVERVRIITADDDVFETQARSLRPIGLNIDACALALPADAVPAWWVNLDAEGNETGRHNLWP